MNIYRPHIDGLRAVAVLAVVFYHAGINLSGYPAFQGGFLGVDVFFVISGYLIAGILLREFANGTFTYYNFYERRARRILPMLFTVMFVSIPFAWLYMLPAPFLAYAKSIFSSVLFGSNFLFWSEGGYTAGPNALKPFLHTWSLSIEEQFYVFFPIVLLLAWKYARQYLMPLFMLGFVVSLGMAEWASRKHTVMDFYFLLTRAWELLAGVIIAKLDTKFQNKKLNVILPAFGLILIVASITGFNDKIPHPSIYTLLPVIGTVLIIYFGGQGDVVSRFLSWKPVVFVGLISYSLYLWHQPVFAFARIRFIDELDIADKLGLLVLTAIISVLSWRWIETPFRNKEKISRRVLVQSLSVSAAILLVFSIAAYFTNGFANRFDFPIINEIGKLQKDLLITKDGKNCHERDVSEACTLGDANSANRWIIVGDSHMGYLSTILWKELESKGASLTIMTKGGCPYAPGMILGKGEADHPCQFDTNVKRREYLLNAKPSVVVIGGRLPYYLTGEGFDNGEGGVELKQGNSNYKLSLKENSSQSVQESLSASIKELLKAGHKVVVIYPAPEIGWDPLETIKKNLLSKSESEFTDWMEKGGVTVSSSGFQARVRDAYAVYDSLGNYSNLYRVYPASYFCDTKVKGRCISHDGSKLYYADQDHLSQLGNKMVVQNIIKQIEAK